MNLTLNDILRLVHEQLYQDSKDPVLELKHIEPRKKPRTDWPYHIYYAAESVSNDGEIEAHDKVPIAKRSSPVRAVLGDVLYATPFRDTTRRSHSPFAY